MTAERLDVVIVGGGILGCSAAAYAAVAGLRVALLEAREIASGTASASGSSVLLQTKLSDELLDLTQRSQREYEALAHRFGVPYRRDGSFVLYRDATEEAFVRERADVLARHGVDVEVIDARATRERQPATRRDVRGASFVRSDGEVQPTGACARLAAVAAEHGACVLEHRPVAALATDGRRVTGVRLPDGRHLAATDVVVAAGHRSNELLASAGVSLDVEIQKGEQLVTVPTSRLLAGRIVSARYLASKQGARAADAVMTAGLAVGQEPGGAIRIGSTREWSTDPSPSAAARRLLLDEVAYCLDGVAALPIARQTVGFRVVSSTGLPLVGRVPGREGLLVSTGHGGDGVALAPLSGRVLQACLSGAAGEAPMTVPEGAVHTTEADRTGA